MPMPFPFPVQIATDICSISRIQKLLLRRNGIDFIRRLLRPEEREENKDRCDTPIEKWREVEDKTSEKEKTQMEKYFGSSNHKTADLPQFMGVVQRIMEKDRRDAEVQLGQAATFLAGRFAAKEAIIKAYPRRRLTFHDIIIRRPPDNESGSQAPIAIVLPEIGKEKHGQIVKISISHDTDFATAVCLAPDVEAPRIKRCISRTSKPEPAIFRPTIPPPAVRNTPTWGRAQLSGIEPSSSLPPVHDQQSHIESATDATEKLRKFLSGKATSTSNENYPGKPANFTDDCTLRIEGLPPTLDATWVRSVFPRAINVHKPHDTNYAFVNYENSSLAIYEGANSFKSTHITKSSCVYLGGEIDLMVVYKQVIDLLDRYGYDHPFHGRDLTTNSKEMMLEVLKNDESMRRILTMSSSDFIKASDLPIDRTVKLEGFPQQPLDSIEQQKLAFRIGARLIYNSPETGTCAVYTKPFDAVRKAVCNKKFKFKGVFVECTYMDPRVNLNSVREVFHWEGLDPAVRAGSVKAIVDRVWLSSFEKRKFHDVTSKYCPIYPEPDEDLMEIDESLRIARSSRSSLNFRSIYLPASQMLRSMMVKIMEPSDEGHIGSSYNQFRQFINDWNEGNPKILGICRAGPVSHYALVLFDTAAAARVTAEKMDQTFLQGCRLRCRYLGEGVLKSSSNPAGQKSVTPISSREGTVERPLHQQPAIESNALGGPRKKDTNATGNGDLSAISSPEAHQKDNITLECEEKILGNPSDYNYLYGKSSG